MPAKVLRGTITAVLAWELPDGRGAFEPLDDSAASPMRGADINGPTAVLNSVIKAGFEDSYTQVLNLKFSSLTLSTPESLDKLLAFTDAFFSQGGIIYSTT